MNRCPTLSEGAPIPTILLAGMQQCIGAFENRLNAVTGLAHVAPMEAVTRWVAPFCQRNDPMYLNAPCPHCGRRIKKISLFVLKPGLITCPGCKKMSAVTGLLKGTLACLAVWMVFCFFLSPLKNALNDSSIIFAVFGGAAILSIYTMSLFLELEK